VPTASFQTLTNKRCVPYYPHMDVPSARQGYALPPSTGSAASPVPAGTVLGEYGGNEVQTLTITATGGTYTLTFNGQTTTAIAFNANAATIQTAFTALSTVGAGNATVTGTGPFVFTFQNALGEQDVSAITVGTGSLTGGTATMAQTTAGVSGQVGAYASGNTNGTQTPRAILEYDTYTDAAGVHYWGSGFWGEGKTYTPCWIHGDFRCEDLTGLDAAALTQTGTRMSQVSGNPSIGVVSLR
jgi:hypothetical protein